MSNSGEKLRLLAAHYPPLKVPGSSDWTSEFLNKSKVSRSIQLVTGYASENSLLELTTMLNEPQKNFPYLKEFNFYLGMAFFDGLTARQKRALELLNNELKDKKLGWVRIPTEITVHSKASLFHSIKDKYSALVGSSNFSVIIPTRRSELDLEITGNEQAVFDLKTYFALLHKVSLPLDAGLLSAIPEVKTQNNRLLAVPGVEVSDQFAKAENTFKIKFALQLKPTEKSNLNKYLSKPRGKIPRNWYEVEINVPNKTGQQKGFPSEVTKSRNFRVHTHDGYSFLCHVSGGPKPHLNKNFESSGSLLILGYWIKGLLVESGVLSEGEKVTEDVLKNYGRDTIALLRIDSTEWLLDFRRPSK